MAGAVSSTSFAVASSEVTSPVIDCSSEIKSFLQEVAPNKTKQSSTAVRFLKFIGHTFSGNQINIDLPAVENGARNFDDLILQYGDFDFFGW